MPGAFPWGIFVVNVSGAFLIGFMVEALEPRFEDSWVRAAVVTGFLGAYTTFSTFSLDTYRLLEEGHTGLAAFNALGTLAAGLVARLARAKLGRLRRAGPGDRLSLAATAARARACSITSSASARLPKPRVSVLPSSRSL